MDAEAALSQETIYERLARRVFGPRPDKTFADVL